jgi:putative hemolysin
LDAVRIFVFKSNHKLAAIKMARDEQPPFIIHKTRSREFFMSVVILFLTMILNGIFAMAEIALVSARPARLQQRVQQGDRGAKTALALMEEPNRFLSAVQIGITLVGIFSGAFGAAQFAGPFGLLLARIGLPQNVAEELAFVLLVVLITYFTLVIGELLPKRIALNAPEAVASTLAIPMRFLSGITKPFVNILSASTEFGIWLFGIKPSQEPAVTEEEIKILIKQGQDIGLIEEAEKEMVSGIFRLGDRRVEALMTPRLEMAWIDINASQEEMWEHLLHTPHSRVPVADGDLDEVLGYIQIRDILGISPNELDFNLQEYIREPIYLPENMAALRALDTFQTSGVHLAIVVDEFGGITGMVTDYDILEAIVGEVSKDRDNTDSLAVQREDGSWLFDGLIVIDQLKEILNISEMPGEKQAVYQTLSGFVMSQLGRIPDTGEKFSYQGYTFEVVDMDGRRVDRVLVSTEKS